MLQAVQAVDSGSRRQRRWLYTSDRPLGELSARGSLLCTPYLCGDGSGLKILPATNLLRFVVSLQRSARIHSNALGEFSAVAGGTRLCVSVLTVQVRTVQALQCRHVAPAPPTAEDVRT